MCCRKPRSPGRQTLRESVFVDVDEKGCASADGSNAKCVKQERSAQAADTVASTASGIPQKSPWIAKSISSSANSDGLRCP